MRLSPQTLARVAAVALVVAAGAVAAMRLGGGGPAGEKKEVRVHPRPDDPLAKDLLRCAELGRAAQDDWVCKRVWAENRERFLAPGKPAPAGKPVEMFPPAPAQAKDQSRLTNGRSAPTADPQEARPPADLPKDE